MRTSPQHSFFVCMADMWFQGHVSAQLSASHHDRTPSKFLRFHERTGSWTAISADQHDQHWWLQFSHDIHKPVSRLLCPCCGNTCDTQLHRLTAICVWRSLINLRKLNKRITDPTISDLSFCTALPEDDASDHATVQRSAEIATDIRLSLPTSRTDPLV